MNLRLTSGIRSAWDHAQSKYLGNQLAAWVAYKSPAKMGLCSDQDGCVGGTPSETQSLLEYVALLCDGRRYQFLEGHHGSRNEVLHYPVAKMLCGRLSASFSSPVKASWDTFEAQSAEKPPNQAKSSSYLGPLRAQIKSVVSYRLHTLGGNVCRQDGGRCLRAQDESQVVR